MPNFNLSQQFKSHEDFISFKNQYCVKTGMCIVVRSSKLIRADELLQKKFLARLKYSYLHYNCISGIDYKNISNPNKSRQNISTRKIGCEFELILTATSRYLVVRKFIDHSHEYPTLKLPEEIPTLELNKIKFASIAGAKSNKIAYEHNKAHGMIHTALIKKIRNILSKNVEENMINKLNENISEIYTNNIFNNQRELVGLIFQDKRMKTVFSTFPEVLVIDSTHKMFKTSIYEQWKSFEILSITNMGVSEPIVLFITKDETLSTLEPIFEFFPKIMTYLKLKQFFLTNI